MKTLMELLILMYFIVGTILVVMYGITTNEEVIEFRVKLKREREFILSLIVLWLGWPLVNNYVRKYKSE